MSCNINSTIEKILENYAREDVLCAKNDKQMPSKPEIISIIDQVKSIVFPGYFDGETIEENFKKHYTGCKVASVYEMLKTQIYAAFLYKNELGLSEAEIKAKSEKTAEDFI